MELINTYINVILFVIGALTCTLVFQAALPQVALRASYKIKTSDPLVLFLARSAAIPVVMIGALLIWASYDETLQYAVVVAAAIGKVAFVSAILMHWSETGRPFLTTIIVDSFSAILLTLYLVSV